MSAFISWWMVLSTLISNMDAMVMKYVPSKKRYFIEENSQLYLKGTTNVNNFTCDCQDRFSPQTVEVENNDTYARFQGSNMSLAIRKFDCHNARIDRDMQQALKANEHPYIKMDLLETWQDSKTLQNQVGAWCAVKAKIRITIAGVSKVQYVEGKACKTGADRMRLSGQKTLQMTEFGITPPEAMFGMIKVNDVIDFYFDLYLRIENQP